MHVVEPDVIFTEACLHGSDFWLASWSGHRVDSAKRKLARLDVDGQAATERFKSCLLAEVVDCRIFFEDVTTAAGLGLRKSEPKLRFGPGCVALLLSTGDALAAPSSAPLSVPGPLPEQIPMATSCSELLGHAAAGVLSKQVEAHMQPGFSVDAEAPSGFNDDDRTPDFAVISGSQDSGGDALCVPGELAVGPGRQVTDQAQVPNDSMAIQTSTNCTVQPLDLKAYQATRDDVSHRPDLYSALCETPPCKPSRRVLRKSSVKMKMVMSPLRSSPSK